MSEIFYLPRMTDRDTSIKQYCFMLSINLYVTAILEQIKLLNFPIFSLHQQQVVFYIELVC